MGYFTDVTASPEYDIQFWNAARGKRGSEDVLAKGRISATGSYQLPASTAGNIEKAMTKESVFRNIATVIKAYKSGYRIVAKDCDDVAEFIPELGEIPVQDGMKDFNETSIESQKLAVFVKLEEDFVRDAVFSLERYLIGRFARNFGRAEENAFINGTGVDEPTGILHESNGAEVGVTTETLTYDDVISLYFSVEKKYRKNAVWMMNDSTALALRTLKDDDGNYLWNHNNDTILGKQVVISEYMPNITPYVCRHTYCSNMAKSGMNPKTLQYLMGHSDISVTMNVYTHISFDDAEEELKRMEEFRKAQAEIEKKSDAKAVSQKMFKVV